MSLVVVVAFLLFIDTCPRETESVGGTGGLDVQARELEDLAEEVDSDVESDVVQSHHSSPAGSPTHPSGDLDPVDDAVAAANEYATEEVAVAFRHDAVLFFLCFSVLAWSTDLFGLTECTYPSRILTKKSASMLCMLGCLSSRWVKMEGFVR